METTKETCPKGNVLSNRLSGNFAINVADYIAPVYGISTTKLFVSTLVQKKADSAIQRSTVFLRRTPQSSVHAGIYFCNWIKMQTSVYKTGKACECISRYASNLVIITLENAILL